MDEQQDGVESGSTGTCDEGTAKKNASSAPYGSTGIRRSRRTRRRRRPRHGDDFVHPDDVNVLDWLAPLPQQNGDRPRKKRCGLIDNGSTRQVHVDDCETCLTAWNERKSDPEDAGGNRAVASTTGEVNHRSSSEEHDPMEVADVDFLCGIRIEARATAFIC